MSFNKPEARGAMHPAKVTYRWSGGEKEITLDDGTTAKKAKAVLRYYDGEENQEAKLPFKFCVIGTTTTIRGYEPGSNGNSVNYYANEVVDFQQKIKLMRRDANGTTQCWQDEAPEGLTYQQIKAKGMPRGCRYTQFVYFYNPVSQQLERFELSGASVSEFIQFSQSNKIYESPITMSEGELKKTPVATFIAPKFEAGEKYSEDQKALLTEVCKEFDAFAAKLTGTSSMTTEGDYEVNQEPVIYDDERSQEVPEPQESTTASTANMNDVPF